MQWRNSDDRYGVVAQFLHWGTFAQIALQLPWRRSDGQMGYRH